MSNSTSADAPNRNWSLLILKVLLVFIFLVSCWGIYRFSIEIRTRMVLRSPPSGSHLWWALPALLGLNVLNATGAVALFQRFQIGFPMILFGYLVGWVINVMVFGVPLTSLIFPLGLLLVLIYLVHANSASLR